MIDVIYPVLPEDEMICLTNGPVFNDLGATRNPPVAGGSAPSDGKPQGASQSALRTWTLTDGRTIEAELSNAVSFDDSVKLIDSNGREQKVPPNLLSEADRKYIAISRVPELDVDFLKSLRNVLYSSKLESGNKVRDPELHASFGVRVKQVGTGVYDHELKAEFFAVGRQIFADRYMVLARESVTFRLTRENERNFEYESKREVPLRDFYLNASYGHYGEKYHGYMVLVTDELGRLVAHEESPDWLFDHKEDMMKLHAGNYFDKECVRRPPIRPASIIRY
jgi:hypothetical protein